MCLLLCLALRYGGQGGALSYTFIHYLSFARELPLPRVHMIIIRDIVGTLACRGGVAGVVGEKGLHVTKNIEHEGGVFL